MRNALVLDRDGGVVAAMRQKHFENWEIHCASDVGEATRLLRDHQCLVGVLVIDRQTQRIAPDLARLIGNSVCEWVAVTESGLLEVPAFGTFVVNGFFDYHTLPVDPQRLLATLGHAYGKARARRLLCGPRQTPSRFGMCGDSPAIRELFRQIDKVIKVDAPVLLSGESGSGKELVARAIHEHSARCDGPFVAMNCAAVPPSLIQSELFGHEKGAFTGAHQRKIGNIEASQGGVLFLDEIGDLSSELQTNLLRFLQEMTIVRLGATQPLNVDTRVIAASHVDLEAAVADGRFRPDLFYRLNVVHLRVPSLRERVEDIRLLAQAVFDLQADKSPARLRGFSEEALLAMEAHLWPGNVRELINRVRSAMIMSEGRLILPEDLGLRGSVPSANAVTLEDARLDTEREVIQRCLRLNGSNVTRSARQLGVSRVTLYRLMSRHNIAP